MPAALVQKAGSASGSAATLVLTVGKDNGTATPGFVSTTAGNMMSLSMGASGSAYATLVTDSRGNTWQVDSQGSSSASGARSGQASCQITTPLVLNDTVTITWSATPANAEAAAAEVSGVAYVSGMPSVDQVAAGHGAVANLTVATGSTADTSGEFVVSAAAASTASGTVSITAADAASGGTWADLAYPAQPGRLDAAYQVATGMTMFSAAWADTAGPGMNMDVCVVCYRPANPLTITATPVTGQVGSPWSMFPNIEGGTGPYALSLASGSGPLPPGLTLIAGGGGGSPGDFGLTYVNHALTGTQPDVSYSAWINGTGSGSSSLAGVGRTPTLLKTFYPGSGGWSDGTGSPTWFPTTPSGDLNYAISHGMKAVLCYKPAYNKSLANYDSTPGSATVGTGHGGTQADWIALKASITALLSNFPSHAARKIEVVLGQEIEHGGLTPVQYWSMWAFYGSAVDAAAGTGHRLHIASAAYAAQMANFFPANQGGGTRGPSAAIVNKASTDCYTHSWLGGYRLDGHDTPGAGTPTATSLVGLCQAAGVTFFGVTEFGMGQGTRSGQVPGDTNDFIDYLAKAAAAYPGTSYAWFGESEKGPNDLIPGFASGLSGGYNAIPHLQNLANAITGAGGGGGIAEVEGTPASDGSWPVTLEASDHLGTTATVTITIVITAVPVPPPPPPGPVPSPRPKAWRFIIATPQPAGTWLAEAGQAQQRTVTFRNGAGQYHEAAIDINGYDPAAQYITELQTDLQVVLDGQVLFCGRFGATQDTLDATRYRFAPSALDYRELLRRRSLAQPGGPNYQGVDVADIAWGLIQATQGSPGGNLGIARGIGKDGLGTDRWMNYIRQNFVGLAIDDLSSRDPGGFDWDITPYGPGDLRLDMWSPNRGSDHGVVLEYGGGLVSSIQRNTDPSTYADDVFYTGQSTSAQTSVAPGSNGGSINNIATWGSPGNGVLAVDDTAQFTPSGSLIVHDSATANAIVDYTGRSGRTFTGCTVRGSPGGTVTTGNYVFQNPLTAVQLDASDITSRPEGRWSAVVNNSQLTTQDAVNTAAAWGLQDAEVVSPSYTITLYPGAWKGPGHIWIGDTVTVRINAGRLQVNDQLQVSELDFAISPASVETLTLTAGRIPFRVNQVIPRMLRRLRALETL